MFAPTYLSVSVPTLYISIFFFIKYGWVDCFDQHYHTDSLLRSDPTVDRKNLNDGSSAGRVETNSKSEGARLCLLCGKPNPVELSCQLAGTINYSKVVLII